MAAKHHSLWKPARVEYAPGVVKVEERREDVYIGDAESLIAAGLARRDEFPGQPGQGATMATYDTAGNPIPQGSNYINGLQWAGRRRISRRGAARFSVGIGVDNDEHEVRRKAWLEAERGSKSNVVPIIRSRGGSPGEGGRVQPSVIAGALPPPSAPAPVARRAGRRAPSRPMVSQPDAHTPAARTLACLADARAILRLLAASVDGSPLDQDGCQRLQGAARTALHLLLEALALADEHTDNDQARMTIYDAAGVADAIQGACFEAMAVDGDPSDRLAPADVAACAQIAARLAGRGAELLAASSAPA